MIMITGSLQEIFDKVAMHLVEQGKPAIDQTWRGCQYRMNDKDGKVLKCAFGIFIPDNRYHADYMEGLRCDELIRDHVVGVETTRHAELLRSLQLAHDRNAKYAQGFDLIALADALNKIAYDYELDFSAENFARKMCERHPDWY